MELATNNSEFKARNGKDFVQVLVLIFIIFFFETNVSREAYYMILA